MCPGPQLRSTAQRQAVRACTYILYDETPLHASVRDGGGSEKQLAPEAKNRQPLQGALLKLFQSELQVVFVVRNKSTDEHLCFCAAVPTRIYSFDTATGETILECLRNMLRSVPLWDRVSEVFKILDASAADRAGSNSRARDGLQYLSPSAPRLRAPCHIHLLSNVQGNVFANPVTRHASADA